MDGSLPSFEERMAYLRSTDELANQIVELAGHLNAGDYRFLKLVAEFDHRKGWNCRATQDCAHWLNWKCGINFLQIALHGTAHHVETLVRAYRRATEAEELSREHQQQLNREVRYQWDDDGSLILKARLPADVGALILKAIDAAIPDTTSPEFPDPRTNLILPPNIDRPSLSHKRADALAVIFESFLAHGAEALSGGERHQVVVHGWLWRPDGLRVGDGRADVVAAGRSRRNVAASLELRSPSHSDGEPPFCLRISTRRDESTRSDRITSEGAKRRLGPINFLQRRKSP